MERIKFGDSGEVVRGLQHRLSIVGYLTTIDGEFGIQTEENLKSFQRDNALDVDGIYGPLTEAVLMQIMTDSHRFNIKPTPVSDSETPWMDWLERNKGEKEIPGTKANPFIIDLFRYTSLKNHPLATTDETAWCAAMACAALEKNGYASPRSASAATFDTYGTESDLKYGAILTFRRTGGSGRHVTFYVGTDSQGRLKCLGGNQQDSLKESAYDRSDLIAVRWPVKMPTKMKEKTPIS